MGDKLKGATVLDIGTGSGILAFLAAKQGAGKVYAVEASRDVAKVASRLARANGLTGIVHVLPKHLEDVTFDEIPANSVDIIVSELFSHFLVGEVGLQAVTIAKKRFLKPGGFVLPEKAWLFLSPFDDKEVCAELRGRHTAFWRQKDFYGLDLTSAVPLAEEQALRQNVLDVVTPESLLIEPEHAVGHELDLAGVDDEEDWRRISFEVEFPPRSRDAVIEGLCGWWDASFPVVGEGKVPLLSTAPDSFPTCWAQCRFLLNKPIAVAKDAALTATCELKLHRARESYSCKIELRNNSTGTRRSTGLVELSNVYARHFVGGRPEQALPRAEEIERAGVRKRPVTSEPQAEG